MVSIFGFKKNFFTGVDFGTSAIKVVELTYKDQKVHLSNYAWADLSAVASRETMEQRILSYDDKLKLYLETILERMKLKSDSAYVALPAFIGLLALLELPEMRPDEMEKAVQYEARKYIPTSLSDVSLGWEIVKREDDTSVLVKKDSRGKVKILMVAAPIKEVDRYEKIVLSTRLKINALELETFSLVRSLIGDDQGTFLLIDIGARITNIILVDRGIILSNRSVNIGGNEITSSIAESLKIARSRAEAMKMEKRDILNSKESALVLPPLELIINEAQRMMLTGVSNFGKKTIDSVILSGGCAKMTGMEEYFSRMLRVPTMAGKPWQKIITDARLASDIEKMGTSFSVALGLALRGVEEYRRS